jgi:hypothetical protein
MSYIFKASSREGFSVKLTAEYLNNVLKFSPFCVNEKGIFLRASDQNNEVLPDIAMLKEDFTVFKCPKPLFFLLNAQHFYKLVKTIKKKDSVTLFIREQRPMQLGISVSTNDEKSNTTTYINITYTQPEEFELPTNYKDPVIVTSKDFQKLKALHSIGTDMTLSISKKMLRFFCNGKNLFTREVEIDLDDDEEDEENEVQLYSQTFTTQHITHLTKCAGQSGNIQFFFDENLPLQIKMQTGSLVKLRIFIKSKELLENEQPEEEEKDEQSEDIIQIPDDIKIKKSGKDESSSSSSSSKVQSTKQKKIQYEEDESDEDVEIDENGVVREDDEEDEEDDEEQEEEEEEEEEVKPKSKNVRRR